MKKNCKKCKLQYEITDSDLLFYDKVSPVFNGKKYQIPAPTMCPDCRQQRRLSFRNERKLYKRKCDLMGKDIVSIYSPDKKTQVYEHSEWYSDKWDPIEYGENFDFGKSFFKQFSQLHDNIPRPSLRINSNENSDYVNLASYNKNTYLVVAASNNVDSYYSTYLQRCNNVVDCCFIFDSEFCYNCIDTYKCYKLSNSVFSNNCSDSSFLYNCQGCKNCFACVNLINKDFHIFNVPYEKKEYEMKLEEVLKNSNYQQKIQFQFENLKNSLPQKLCSGIQNENVSGDHIFFSKNSLNSYDCTYLEGCKNCTWLHKSKDCYDCYAWGLSGELGYENHLCGDDFYQVLFCESCEGNISNLLYCRLCHNVQDCFGCIGLKHKKYCILNKQYTKEEYEELVPKIIEHMQKTGEWGEFFPSWMSPFGYNETVASEYFPLTRDAVCHAEVGSVSESTDVNTCHAELVSASQGRSL